LRFSPRDFAPLTQNVVRWFHARNEERTLNFRDVPEPIFRFFAAPRRPMAVSGVVATVPASCRRSGSPAPCWIAKWSGDRLWFDLTKVGTTKAKAHKRFRNNKMKHRIGNANISFALSGRHDNSNRSKPCRHSWSRSFGWASPSQSRIGKFRSWYVITTSSFFGVVAL
jgi:hypothetical protein